MKILALLLRIASLLAYLYVAYAFVMVFYGGALMPLFVSFVVAAGLGLAASVVNKYAL